MAGSADFVQRVVHALETGGLAVWVRRGLLLLIVLTVAFFYFWNFRGLATAEAMDQAQIGRFIAHGHGWRTNFIRPRAVGQLQAHGKNPLRVYYDTYQAPLPPLVDAIALFPVKSHLKMTPADAVYAGDKAIVTMSILLFFASIAVLFFLARHLFDQRLALLACGLVLVCDAFWQYSLSGLPQMLMLLLFNLTIYALALAIQARNSGGFVGVWLAAVGVGFGLLALTHALTIWIFVPALIFCVFYFRPRGWAAGIVLTAFLILYVPWLLRNLVLTGNPGGAAIYTLLDGLSHSEAGWMRRVDLNMGGVLTPSALHNKFTANLIGQSAQLFGYLGWNVVALMFFAALTHVFKRAETGTLRWLILLMWAGAVAGMAFYGIRDEQGVAANQLHIIFIPIMICFGLAFLLVQWNRLDIQFRLARIGFLTLLYLLCAVPMIFATVLSPWKPNVRWPPYLPPATAVLNGWMKPDEIIASDMPWAVAWYADRRSLWIPESFKTFTDFNDYAILGGPVNGLYLTPISGSQNKLGDVLNGDYREWTSLILRTVNLEKFPLKWGTLLGDRDCVFYSDHDRKAATTQ